MTLRIAPLSREELAARLPDLARLRIAVFADWPYLYDGDEAYEARYLQAYLDSPDSIVVGAFDGERLVGAATGTPMEDHAEEFAQALAGRDLPLRDIFYCAESVLLPAYRGRGVGHRFFDLREEHARRLDRHWSVFCAVVRPQDHPARPPGYWPLDGFWAARGYAPLPGAVARFRWRDHGEAGDSEKPLQVWIRDLAATA
ncbi:GNAT family N-acetyltransferase [Rubellimicrobium roseum]|uniref:GNAT family N-acetyltransferase n=1 Tax=Rubellimicrobium roseum TaxID=687525 RepID=A0A5C4NFP3_9RHOB|nr:GNAT family N-acetyltransferase [Rubellimicrobium roseum]TNC72952.1 GNAT family N-acetyltransferase [Rubellimicrobium roseum]